MKKRITLLSLFLFICIAAFSQGQNYGRTRISFNDINGDGVFPIPQVMIRNSDSASNSNNPLNMLGVSVEWKYSDSFSFDTSYHGTDFTLNYFACGQWNKVDFTYHRTNYGSLILDTVLVIPCQRPCSAGFSYSSHMLFYYNQYQFFSIGGASIKHEWALGDGRIYRWSNPSNVQYDTVGAITVRHVIHDTIRNCRDTAYMNLNIPPICNGGFTGTNLGNLLYEFNATNSNAYSHTWIIDGDTVIAGRTYQHQFTSSGYHSVYHISSYQNSCSQQYGYNNLNVQPCQVSVGYTNQYGLITFFPSNTTKPLHYRYGDGDTATRTGNHTHQYSQSGNYYVIVSDPSNICNSKSITITIQTFCTSTFSISTSTPFTFFVNGPAHSSFGSRYIMSTGDTLYGDTATYQVNTSGAYTIRRELYNSQGQMMCNNQTSFYFNSCGMGTYSYNNDLLRGVVRFNSQYKTNYGSIRVYLIKHKSSLGTLTAVDSVDLNSSGNDTGYFEFTQQCDTNADYLVKAALLSSSSIYSSYLPTYFQSSSSWSNATPVNTSSFAVLDMISGTNPGGPGFIGGLISQGANKKFKPLSGIQVNLFTEQGVAVAYAYSNLSGAYSFDKLAYGKYKVSVEELGKTSASYWVTLDANNSKAEERNFEVNSSYVSILNTSLEDPKVVSGIYPNPVTNSLYIDWSDDNNGEVQVIFYSLEGKVLKSIQIAKDGKQSQIDVSDLPSGMMLLRIISDEGQSSQFIQKK